MKNFKKLLILGGLIVGAGLQADHCSNSGVSITNMASVPGVNYTFYVNIGNKPKKSEAAIFGLASGYTKLDAEKSVCFKNGFKKSDFLFVRQAHEKGQSKNMAYQFDVAAAGINIKTIKSIDIVPGARDFIRINVYGEDDSMMNLRSTELVDMNPNKTDSK